MARLPARSKTTALALCLLLGACATGGSGGATAADSGPAKLKHDPDDVPAAVRAIEAQIERRGIILADHIEIDVSRNYEWDVSLTGDDVSKAQATEDGGMVSVAKGSPRAIFRQLELRAYQTITLKCSGMGVVPYIRIRAKGHAAHARFPDPEGPPRVRRAQEVHVENEKLHLFGDAAQPASTGG